MKPRAKANRRDIFVLTPEEKSTVCFVLAMFVLGVTAKNYRKTHSIPPAKIGIAQTAKNAGLPAEKRAEAKRRKATR